MKLGRKVNDDTEEVRAMRFCRDREQDGWFWVDRGIDGKADHFKPCTTCNTGLEVSDLEEKLWSEFDLCGYCNTRLETLSAILEASERRPHIMDREPTVIPYEEAFPDRVHQEEIRDPYYAGDVLEDLLRPL